MTNAASVSPRAIKHHHQLEFLSLVFKQMRLGCILTFFGLLHALPYIQLLPRRRVD